MEYITETKALEINEEEKMPIEQTLKIGDFAFKLDNRHLVRLKVVCAEYDRNMNGKRIIRYKFERVNDKCFIGHESYCEHHLGELIFKSKEDLCNYLLTCKEC